MARKIISYFGLAFIVIAVLLNLVVFGVFIKNAAAENKSKNGSVEQRIEAVKDVESTEDTLRDLSIWSSCTIIIGGGLYITSEIMKRKSLTKGKKR